MPTMTPMRLLPPLEAATTPGELQDSLSQAFETARLALLSQERAAVAARIADPANATQPLVLSPENFTRTLTAMQAHYAGTTAALASHAAIANKPAAPALFKLSPALAFRPVLKTLTVNDVNNEPPPPPPHILTRAGDAAADNFVAGIHSASLSLI